MIIVYYFTLKLRVTCKHATCMSIIAELEVFSPMDSHGDTLAELQGNLLGHGIREHSHSIIIILTIIYYYIIATVKMI